MYLQQKTYFCPTPYFKLGTVIILLSLLKICWGTEGTDEERMNPHQNGKSTSFRAWQNPSSNPSSTDYQLCNLEHVTQRLWTSFSHLKNGSYIPLFKRLVKIWDTIYKVLAHSVSENSCRILFSLVMLLKSLWLFSFCKSNLPNNTANSSIAGTVCAFHFQSVCPILLAQCESLKSMVASIWDFSGKS